MIWICRSKRLLTLWAQPHLKPISPPKWGGKTCFFDFLAKNRRKFIFAIFFHTSRSIDGHFEHHFKTPTKSILGVLVSRVFLVLAKNDRKYAKMTIFDHFFAIFDPQNLYRIHLGPFPPLFGHFSATQHPLKICAENDVPPPKWTGLGSKS